MKVWVVHADSGSCASDHDGFIAGVFATKELAEAQIEVWRTENKARYAAELAASGCTNPAHFMGHSTTYDKPEEFEVQQ